MNKRIFLIVSLAGAVFALSVLYIVFSSADHVVVTQKLEINGLTNRLRAYAQGSDFWISQCSLAERQLKSWVDGPEDYRKRQEEWDNLTKEIDSKMAGLGAVFDMLDERDPAIKIAEKLEEEKKEREDAEFLEMLHQNYLKARPQAIQEYTALVDALTDYIVGQGWRSEFYRPSLEKGFRGIQWGTDLSSLPEFEVKQRNNDSILYRRIGDTKKIGDIDTFVVAYSTDLNSRFEQIIISFVATSSGDVSRYLDHELGVKGYLYDVADAEVTGYTWNLNNLDMNILLLGDSSYLYISRQSD